MGATAVAFLVVVALCAADYNREYWQYEVDDTVGGQGCIVVNLATVNLFDVDESVVVVDTDGNQYHPIAGQTPHMEGFYHNFHQVMRISLLYEIPEGHEFSRVVCAHEEAELVHNLF